MAVHEFAPDVEAVIRSVEEKKRFLAIKLMEKDDKLVDQMQQVPDLSINTKHNV